MNEMKSGLEECDMILMVVGDICTAEITINGDRVLLAVVYLSNGTTLNDKMKFLERYRLPYWIKVKGLFLFIDEMKLYNLLIMVCGDFNINFRSHEGKQFREFMHETFGCKLNNLVEVSTTRNMTCIDGIFAQNILNIYRI